MIRSVKFKEPHYAVKLENIGSKKFTFDPRVGVTYLFGPNGCGKSTVLKAIAKASGIPPEGGWSKFCISRDYSTLEHPKTAADVGKALQAGGLVVDWDGSPTIFLDSTKSDANLAAFGVPIDGMEGPDNGDDLYGKTVNAFFGKRQLSSGQWRESRLGMLMQHLKSRSFPDLRTIPKAFTEKTSVWHEDAKAFSAYITSLEPTGFVTVILDEPDRSFSLPYQHILHTKVFPEIGKYYQLIVATHSPFAIFNKEATLIDMKPGYKEECAAALLEAMTNA